MGLFSRNNSIYSKYSLDQKDIKMDFKKFIWYLDEDPGPLELIRVILTMEFFGLVKFLFWKVTGKVALIWKLEKPFLQGGPEPGQTIHDVMDSIGQACEKMPSLRDFFTEESMLNRQHYATCYMIE
ncbi:MAG: hypothetical protein ACD_74C00069G0001 [uncultured bacterium]|jgi:hypothetical protein|nr:MAG: hypothetical protein ACD_74C00069G0001 [uncultured bacterium]